MAGQITAKENYRRVIRKEKASWFPTTEDLIFFNPAIIPDNIARGMVFENKSLAPGYEGGKDMFGVSWYYIPEVMGSMTKEEDTLLLDVNEWEEVIRFPDLDTWDWKGCAERNRGIYFDTDKPSAINVVSGLFERLISFLGYEEALVSLIDEDSQNAVKALFSQLCLFYDEYFERLADYFHTDVIQFHDDWGSQRAPMFSLQVCNEMLTPYLKRVVESCHKRGMIFEFHCCGKNEPLVPAMAEAGIDIWNGQPLNDFDSLIPLYGDRIVFGVSPEKLPENVSDEAAWESGRKFVEKYVHFYREGKPIAVFSRRAHPKQVEAINQYSREALELI